MLQSKENFNESKNKNNLSLYFLNSQSDDNESLTTLELSLNMEESKKKNNFLKEEKNNSIKSDHLFLGKKKYKKLYTPYEHRTKKEKLSDRFIPLNKGLNLMEKFNLSTYSKQSKDNLNISSSKDSSANKKDLFNQILRKNIIKDENTNSFNFPSIINNSNNNRDFIKEKIFSFKKEYSDNFKENYINYNILSKKSENKNIIKNDISPKPYKELNVGKLLDDFYLNILDWSSKNLIAIGCTYSVQIFNNNNSQFSKLFEYGNHSSNKYVSSLIWNESGDKLAVGNSDGYVEIYDINRNKIISSFNSHVERVGVVAWNGNIISSGSKDCSIVNRDLRSKTTIRKFLGHKQEICGLKWSFDGSQLASGSNDNLLMVWNLNNTKPIMAKNDHIAAVKALAWSPHKHNILATGGGTADKTIRFWNTTTFEEIKKYDTGSQVCNLLFSRTSNELVSTHGYSLNQINIWKLPNMQNIKTLIGHNYRVLYLSLSPDGQSIVTGAGEKCIKFWNVFPPKKEPSYNNLFPSSRDFR